MLVVLLLAHQGDRFAAAEHEGGCAEGEAAAQDSADLPAQQVLGRRLDHDRIHGRLAIEGNDVHAERQLRRIAGNGGDVGQAIQEFGLGWIGCH